MTDDSVRIFVFSHKPVPDEFPKTPEYRFVQCNSVAGRLSGFDMFDNEAGTTSDLNWCFSEATGMDRILRDRATWGNAEHLGFAHYRRYLNIDASGMDKSTIYCHRFDIGNTVLGQYIACGHMVQPYIMLMSHLKQTNASLHNKVKKYFEREREFYVANCFITSRGLFEQYADFTDTVFPILEEICRSGRIDVNNCSNYQKRYIGFLIERLTSYWIYDMKNGHAKVMDIPMIDLNIKNIENGIR